MQGLSSPGLLLLGDDSIVNANVSSLLMTGNRINSLIDRDTKGNEGGLLSAIQTGKLSVAELEMELVDLLLFLFTVSIVQVSQCVVTSNIITSGELSFALYDTSVASPQLVVMSNLFKGFMSVSPPNYPAMVLQAAPQACIALLNTMII